MGLVLVGFDGSPPSRRAVEFAAGRAVATGDELVLVTVVPQQVRGSTLGGLTGLELPAGLNRTFEENARARLDELAEALGKAGAKVRVEVRMGPAGKTILALAAELPASQIVIGHKAFEGPHLTLGHNADEVLRGAKVPVTVVP